MPTLSYMACFFASARASKSFVSKPPACVAYTPVNPTSNTIPNSASPIMLVDWEARLVAPSLLSIFFLTATVPRGAEEESADFS